MTKTNAMRLLEQAQIPFEVREYEYDETKNAGKSAANQVGMDADQVFKTLVTRSPKNTIYVFCIPSSAELNLKKAAKATNEKKIEMTHVKELLGLTGYIRGGCSPIGMKKKYQTFIDETAQLYEEIAVSAGVRGMQIICNPNELIQYIEATTYDLAE